MVWVKSEYAGELAVVSAWISALLPWYVSVTPEHAESPGTVAFVRFPFLQVRYIFGFPLADAVRADFPLGARGMIGGDQRYLTSLRLAYDLWIVGAVVVALAVALSVAMYVDQAGVRERLPVPPVRVMGGLVVLAGVLFSGATLQFYLRTIFGEWPIPIGLPVLLGLGVILLRVDLVGADGNGGDEDTDGTAEGRASG